MKSPADLASQLAKQWHRSDLRVARLLDPDSWPVSLNIGKPSAAQMQNHTALVQQHLQAWRAIAENGNKGIIEYEPVNYRSTAKPVNLPLRWVIHSPSQWIAAAADKAATAEFQQLGELVTSVNPVYRERLVRERSLWRGKPNAEVIQLCKLTDQLEPGIAHDRPLRLLSGFGVDTKLIERNTPTLQKLLDERFNGTATEQGLLTFLDAAVEKDHWLLIKPLSDDMLPFKRLRLSTTELVSTQLPASTLIIVENEQCEHLLPNLPDTIAILGAGLDLGWLGANHFQQQRIIYWGDIDSWGLLMLARAQALNPSIEPMLMDTHTYTLCAAQSAVEEPSSVTDDFRSELQPAQQALYNLLVTRTSNRLEQEYIPAKVVQTALLKLGLESKTT